MENGALLTACLGGCIRWHFQRNQVIRKGKQQTLVLTKIDTRILRLRQAVCVFRFRTSMNFSSNVLGQSKSRKKVNL